MNFLRNVKKKKKFFKGSKIFCLGVLYRKYNNVEDNVFSVIYMVVVIVSFVK